MEPRVRGSSAEARSPESAAPDRAWLGLRLQIVLSVAVIAVIAFVPLFLAVASLTRHVLRTNREEVARSLGRSVAGRLAADASKGSVDEALRDVALASLESTDGDANRPESTGNAEGVVAIRIARLDRAPIEAGSASTLEALRALESPDRPERSTKTATDAIGPILDVEVPTRGGIVQVALRVGDQASRAAPLLRLVAFYTASFAIVLIVFTYLLLTRLLVRPIGELVGATRRLEAGSRRLEPIRRGGSAEVNELARAIARSTSLLFEREDALAAKVQQLEAARADLLAARDTIVRAERLASVGRLVAGLAHEVGNPVAALLGLEDVLLDGELDEETRDLVSRMKRETERVHRVMRDLLDFARADQPSAAAGIGPASEPSASQLREVIDEVIALVAPQRSMRGVKIEIDVATSLPTVRLAPARLQQVLLNLVMNAADALTAGGDAHGRIVLAAAREVERPYVRLTVNDDGPGVAAGVRAALFEPFVTTKEVGKGTGLGLAVCRGLVEGAGGSIRLGEGSESSLGGACFVLLLPTLDAPSPARSVAPPPMG